MSLSHEEIELCLPSRGPSVVGPSYLYGHRCHAPSAQPAHGDNACMFGAPPEPGYTRQSEPGGATGVLVTRPLVLDEETEAWGSHMTLRGTHESGCTSEEELQSPIPPLGAAGNCRSQRLRCSQYLLCGTIRSRPRRS